MANQKSLTLNGRLSFPAWTLQEAFDLSQKGDYPVDSIEKARPTFQVILNKTQYDKAVDHFVNVFLPGLLKAEPVKGKTPLEAGDIKKLIDTVTGDLNDQDYHTPLKPANEKVLALVPDAAAVLKVLGRAGQLFEQRAVVRDEDELLIPDGDILHFPTIQPIEKTTHKMYAGCVVATTLNLYAYRNGKRPGFSAGTKVVVFKMDAQPFGGGATLDESEVLAD